MRKHALPPRPSALICAALQDGKRILFLVRQNHEGKEEIALPCVEVMKGDDQVGAIVAEFNRATGIDGHVAGTAFTGEYNAGSRKRRAWIPAIAFKFEAKNTQAKCAAMLSSYKILKGLPLSAYSILSTRLPVVRRISFSGRVWRAGPMS